jgi:hypothetical protein
MHDDGAGSKIFITGTEDGSGIEDDGLQAIGGSSPDFDLGAVLSVSIGPFLGGIVPGVAFVHDGESLVGIRGALGDAQSGDGGCVNEPPNSALLSSGEDILSARDMAGAHLISVAPASDTTATVVKNLDVARGESKRFRFEEISLYWFDRKIFQ